MGPVPDQALPRMVCVPTGSTAAGAGSVIGAPHSHDGDGLVGAIGPLVDVVAGLELADVGLGEHVDAVEPFDGGDGEPVRDDEAEGAPWSGRSGSPFIS